MSDNVVSLDEFRKRKQAKKDCDRFVANWSFQFDYDYENPIVEADDVQTDDDYDDPWLYSAGWHTGDTVTFEDKINGMDAVITFHDVNLDDIPDEE